MPTHYNRTKLAAGDQVKVVLPEGEIVRCRIVEVKDDGVISIVPPTSEVVDTGKKKGRKKVAEVTSGSTVDICHASAADEGDTYWYAFHHEEKLDASEEGVLSLEHISGTGPR